MRTYCISQKMENYQMTLAQWNKGFPEIFFKYEDLFNEIKK